MTVKGVRFGGTDWADGDILYAADQTDTITRASNEPWYKVIYNSSLSNGLIRFSASIWQSEDQITTDSGDTWSAGGYDATADEDLAATSGASGIAADNSDGSMAWTDDSGATWQAASVGAPNVTTINDVAMGSTTVGVACGTAASGNYVWYTSDGGDNWTQATTGPTAETHEITMASATVGYMVGAGGSIWKTTDSGVNWTDTTDAVSYATGSFLATTTDIVYSIKEDRATLQKYVNSTNTITTLLTLDYAGGTANATSNLVKATNGNVYFAYWQAAISASLEIGTLTLFKSDGTDVFMKPIGLAEDVAPSTDWTVDNQCKPNLIEGAANVLYLNIGTANILEINVEDE